jgi:hypothetical protein
MKDRRRNGDLELSNWGGRFCPNPNYIKDVFSFTFFNFSVKKLGSIISSPFLSPFHFLITNI